MIKTYVTAWKMYKIDEKDSQPSDGLFFVLVMGKNQDLSEFDKNQVAMGRHFGKDFR